MIDVFEKYVAAPLRSVLGLPLNHVDYWTMYCDEPFNVGNPNEFGVQSIRLDLGRASLYLWPGWFNAFRDRRRHFGLELTLAAQFSKEADERLIRRRADQADLWARAVGNYLKRAAVWGVGTFPHAICFAFGDTEVAVSTGSASGDYPAVGDGDDLLAMTPTELQLAPLVFGPPMEVIWSAEAHGSPWRA